MVKNNLTVSDIKFASASDQLALALTSTDIEIVSAALTNHNTTNETILKAVQLDAFNPDNLEIIVNNIDYKTVNFVRQIIESLITFFDHFYIKGAEEDSFDGEKVYNILAAIQALLIKAPLTDNQIERLFNVVQKIESSEVSAKTIWNFEVSCDEIRKLVLFHSYTSDSLKYEIWDNDPEHVATILRLDEVRGGKLVQRYWFTQTENGVPLHIAKWFNMPTRIKIALLSMPGQVPVIGLKDWINENANTWKQEIINHLKSQGYDVNEKMPMEWLSAILESIEN